MSWNYRIVRYADGSGFGLHEVHYEADGTPIRMTEQPCGFAGDTAQDVQVALMRAKMDAQRRPIFDEPPEWTEPICKRCKRLIEKVKNGRE